MFIIQVFSGSVCVGRIISENGIYVMGAFGYAGEEVRFSSRKEAREVARTFDFLGTVKVLKV